MSSLKNSKKETIWKVGVCDSPQKEKQKKKQKEKSRIFGTNNCSKIRTFPMKVMHKIIALKMAEIK